MKFRISSALLLLIFAGSVALGQSPGSIQSSWDNADKKKAPPRAAVKKQMPPPAAPGAYTAWDKMRSAPGRPWPYLPASPSGADYHAANVMLLDSLQSLYCLSSGYLRGLRAKNEHLFFSGRPEAGKQFQYTDTPPPPPPPPPKEGLATLYGDLQTLLNNCLHGR